MKKLMLFVLVSVAVSFAVLPAFAADDFWSTVQSDIPAGIAPDSFWYWIDVASERGRSFLTLSKEAKLNYILGVANEKISEAQKMVQDDLPDATEEALAQYDYNIARAQQIFAGALEDGKVFAQETQDNLEDAILLHEKMVKMSILKIPEIAMSGMDAIYKGVASWFNEFLAHLKWKRGQIDVKEAGLTD